MRPVLFSLLLCLAASAAAAAQQAPAPPPPPQHPPVHAVRVNDPIVIDGILDEEVWQGPPSAEGFRQQSPVPGAPESQRTAVWVAYDDDALYVAARLYDTSPDSIVARLGRRDDSSGSDEFVVCLDTFHDKRTGYYFGLSAAGTLFDGVLLNDSWDDNSWDGVWNGRVHRDARGWTAEMRIPLSQVRFRTADHMVWGVNFNRTVSRRNETDRMVIIPLRESGFVSRFADLVGLDGLHSQRKIEVLPYTTGKAEYLVHDRADPFNDGSRYTPALGGDLRTSLGSNLTLNATVNPDFGQVEIDPAVVNLSDVESYFQEKRPFFTEGLSVFRCGNNGASDYWNFNWPEPTFFYSRRIGRAPGGSLPDDALYSNVPVATRILGAAKITGQPQPGFNVGVLQALTQKEMADYELSDSTRGSTAVEPMTYYGVLRGLRSFNHDRQGLGLMTLETARMFNGTNLDGQFNRNALVGTMDGWTALDPKKDWVLSGYVTGSRVDGTTERMTSLQQDPRHYYQRPDRSDLGVDPNATSLQGAGARLWVNHEKGPWLSNSAIGFLTPGYEVNDLGFGSRSDVINGHLGLAYNWDKPNGWRDHWYVLGAVAQMWNFGGQHTMNQLFLKTQLEQVNGLSWDLSGGSMGRSTNDRGTRGGPAMLNPKGGWVSFNFDTNSKEKLFWWLSVNPDFDDAGSHSEYYETGLTWRPRAGLALTAGPSFAVNHQDAQYVTQATDPLATSTYGGRYAFAVLDQKTAAAEFRVDWSMTPNLSLQLYAQPLVSSGRYSQYKELAQAGTYDFLVYGTNGSTITRDSDGNYIADPDGGGPAPAVDLGAPSFNYRSVRGNVVLRWEYLPGSTAYVVWTQERDRQVYDDGSFHLRPTLSELGRTAANNIFLVKVSHHFEL